MQIGDIPDAEIKPPDNVLFVCKLNPVTEVSAYFVFSGGDIFMYMDLGKFIRKGLTRKEKLAENMRDLSFLQHFCSLQPVILHPILLVPLS